MVFSGFFVVFFFGFVLYLVLVGFFLEKDESQREARMARIDFSPPNKFLNTFSLSVTEQEQ